MNCLVPPDGVGGVEDIEGKKSAQREWWWAAGGGGGGRENINILLNHLLTAKQEQLFPAFVMFGMFMPPFLPTPLEEGGGVIRGEKRRQGPTMQ